MSRRTNVLSALGLAAGVAWAAVSAGAAERCVKASDFGWNATNATACLLRAIDSGAERVVIDRPAGDWIVDPVRVKGRKDLSLELEKGVRVVARRGGFRGLNDALFSFKDCDNLKIVGNGGELAMWKVDYTNTAVYALSEWRHGIELRGCHGVEIADLRIVETGGDGIYIADCERSRRESENVVIRRVVCDRNTRQGMSVISVDGLLVEKCVFSNTCGRPPQSGVDLEPNGCGNRLKDIVFRDCEAYGNAGAGFEIAKWLLYEISEPTSVTFERCKAHDNRCGLGQFGAVQVCEQRIRDMRGVVRYKDCVFVDKEITPDAFRFREKGKANFRIICENCIVHDPTAPNGQSRLDLDWGEPIGEKELHGLKLTRARIPEEVHVYDPHPNETAKVSAPLLRGGYYRFLAYAAKPGRVRFKVRQHQVGRSALSKSPFVVTDRDRKRIAEMPAAGATAEWRSFEAPKVGFYVIDVRLGGHALDITAISHPMAAIVAGPHADRLPAYFGRTGELFFCVPYGTEKFGVGIGGSGSEKISGRIYDPSGAECAGLQNAGWESYFPETTPASGIWKLAFEKPTEGGLEDFYADLIGLDPVFFLSPRKYWYPKTRCGQAEVKASAFGWDASDATAALQAALDSGAKKVIVDRQAGDWVVRPLFVRSNTEVVFEDGVVVRAKADAFHHPNDCLFLLRDVENVTLRGEGRAVLRMDRDTYADRSRYSFSEWRHTLSIIGCRNVKASGLELRHSGGDGVYVCRSEDVDLRRLDVRDHYRQGISVISARRLYVGQSRFNDTRGTPPACGIDFEPNSENEYLVDCVIDGCEFAGNQHGGVLFHLLQFSDKTEPVSVTVKNCRLTGNAFGLIVGAASNYKPPVKGRILIENCDISGHRGRSATFNGLSASSVAVELKGCRIESAATDCADIEFNNNSFVEDFAGLRFTDTVLKTAIATPVSFLAAMGTGVASVDGTLTVERAGERKPFDFAAFAAANKPDPEIVKLFGVSRIDYTRLRPVSDKPVTKALPPSRGKFTFVQAMPTEGEYAVEFRTRKLGGSPIRYEVRMRDKLGTDLGVVAITAAVQRIVFKGGPDSVRRFEINTKGHALSIFSPHPGQGLRIDDKVNVFGGTHRLHFAVPAAAEKVVMKVEPEEPAAFAILDGEGRTLAEKPTDSMMKLFDLTRKPGQDEVWSVKVVAVEDVCFRAGSSIVPLVASEKDAILVER